MCLNNEACERNKENKNHSNGYEVSEHQTTTLTVVDSTTQRKYKLTTSNDCMCLTELTKDEDKAKKVERLKHYLRAVSCDLLKYIACFSSTFFFFFALKTV